MTYNNEKYILNGIQAGMLLGYVGNTGANSTDPYAQYMSGYSSNSFFNNSDLWNNIQTYSCIRPDLFNYNQFIKHNSNAYIANFWSK